MALVQQSPSRGSFASANAFTNPSTSVRPHGWLPVLQPMYATLPFVLRFRSCSPSPVGLKRPRWYGEGGGGGAVNTSWWSEPACSLDRKSTRLNSSHLGISYAVFCLKKKIQT